MKVKLLVCGLPFSGNINHDGFTELFGNSVRAWSVFHYFNEWEVETYFYLPDNVKISDRIKQIYNNRFIYGSADCSVEVLESFDYVIITSTRLLHFSKNVSIAPKIAASDTKIILALCYDDTSKRSDVCKKIISKSVAAGFVSPFYISDPQKSFEKCYKYRITSGVSKATENLISSFYQEREKSIAFVGFIHSLSFCRLISNVASILPSYRFKLSSLSYTDWATKEKFSIRPECDFDAARTKFLDMFRSESGQLPNNISYTYTKNIDDEIEFLASSSVGIDYCWGSAWKFDNSKVNRYLSYGLPVITTGPSLSYRHVRLIENHGTLLPFNPSVDSVCSAIKQLTQPRFQNLQTRLRVANTAQLLFDWRNVAFEIYEAVLGSYYQT